MTRRGGSGWAGAFFAADLAFFEEDKGPGTGGARTTSLNDIGRDDRDEAPTIVGCGYDAC